LKRFVFLSLSLIIVILIPGCFTFQTPAPPVTPPVATPPVIVAFSSTPSVINSGGTSTLLWNVTGAASVSIDQGIGMVDVAGTRVISPTVSTIYTINATNAAGTVTRSSLTTLNPASPPPAPVPFSVTSVIANIEPLTFTGVCPKILTLSATFTANGPGAVTYRWERSDIAYSDVKSIIFDEAGTKTITSQWELSESATGWYRVHVLTPRDTTSIPVNYLISCSNTSLVTGVVVSVDPNSYTGVCPKAINFWATITANGPGTITYQWERSDGAIAPVQSITFPSTGAQMVSTTWTRGGGTGWQRLHILTPNDVTSNQIDFTVNCVP